VLISVIAPCFDEQEVLPTTHQRLMSVLVALGEPFEIVYVDDGSRDRTAELIRSLADAGPNVRGVLLSRNFGHQAAVTAGLDVARGDAVVIIDADLQDPPELIPQMVALWREGNEVVYGRRVMRKGESGFKRWTAKAFYRTLNSVSEVPIPLDVGDFRLMDRRIVDILRDMRERDRLLRGMVAWVGFRQHALDYSRDARTHGVSKYPLRKMLWLAIDGCMSFSLAPLRVAVLLGLFVVALAVVGIVYAIAMRLLTEQWVSGWTLLFITSLLMGGIQLTLLGVMGEYVGRIYMAGKERPLYVVRDLRGFQSARQTEDKSA
jgi:dolichol-phosphate mannosyltransferase